MRRRLLHPLDQYVLSEFTKIFVTTALGFPVLVIVINLVDQLDKYLNRHLSKGAIAMGYLYGVPETMFQVLPAAVLFATVFSIGAFTRHAEITAAKASGISFHRLIAPIFAGAIVVTGFALLLGEFVPYSNVRRNQLLQETPVATSLTDRSNFAYAAGGGRVYKVATLNVGRGEIEGLEIERQGHGSRHPAILQSAKRASWNAKAGWMLHAGELHVLPDSSTDLSIGFDSARVRQFNEPPTVLLANPKETTEMRYGELERFIAALERSGGDVREMKVELALKIAIPVTCIIIAIFGAPLATSTQRGGTAYGIGVSLATTVLFLMLIQITKAVGGGGLLPPVVAAWLPNALFGTIGLLFLLRAKT